MAAAPSPSLWRTTLLLVGSYWPWGISFTTFEPTYWEVHSLPEQLMQHYDGSSCSRSLRAKLPDGWSGPKNLTSTQSIRQASSTTMQMPSQGYLMMLSIPHICGRSWKIPGMTISLLLCLHTGQVCLRALISPHTTWCLGRKSSFPLISCVVEEPHQEKHCLNM